MYSRRTLYRRDLTALFCPLSSPEQFLRLRIVPLRGLQGCEATERAADPQKPVPPALTVVEQELSWIYNPHSKSSYTYCHLKTRKTAYTFTTAISSNSGLIGIKLIVPPLLLQQFFMATLLGDAALLDHQDLVGLPDGAEAVGDHKGGATLH
ncbi:hypothetical protein C8E01_11090 [Pontibacter virosus]|uniref:Uncharacterized protein n=1 Tax=Pontibacter virosus TaxID=1765052 RepID=A0A2U1ATL1_9BACT|nr:hypothetical protein C8E01_11090 [Pontibacter virosus]